MQACTSSLLQASDELRNLASPYYDRYTPHRFNQLESPTQNNRLLSKNADTGNKPRIRIQCINDEFFSIVEYSEESEE